MIEAISSVMSAMVPTAAPAMGPAFTKSSTTSFESLITDADRQIKKADSDVLKLAVGDGESLHGVMMELQAAQLSLGLVVQVRNRLVEAYQDLMRMQI